MDHKVKHKGLGRLVKATRNSIDGLVEAVKTEEAIRYELALIIILLPVIFVIDTTAAEKAILMFSLFWIFVVELVNTAIETIVDRVSADYHLLSKRAKDLGSAVVFVSIISTAVIWIVIIGKNYFG